MFPFDISPLFSESSLVAQPATYIDAAGVSKDIQVIANLDESASQAGDNQIANQVIRVRAQTNDVQDANKNCKMRLHDLLTDENNVPITDENGNQLIGENSMALNIINVWPDNSGITIFLCSLN